MRAARLIGLVVALGYAGNAHAAEPAPPALPQPGANAPVAKPSVASVAKPSVAPVAKPTAPSPEKAPPAVPKPAAPPSAKDGKPPARIAEKSPPRPKAGAAHGKAARVASQRGEDPRGRRSIAGGPTFDEASLGAESPELDALHDVERELFPPAMPPLGTPWPDNVPSPVAREGTPVRPHTNGVLPAPPNEAPREPGRDLTWLEGLDMPELPVRWDTRLVRYLEFWKNDPRGHSMFATWLRRSGRYRDTIKKTFAKKGVPEDLVWLAMVESGFEPTARSPVGALGMWQFMPETGKIYGLTQDRWADQRIHVQSATEAAADFLLDLYRRFGTWDLSMAAYNMGYGGITSVVKKYNTNDYWALSKLEGSLPWETTLYVPKILSCAIVAKNLAKFGFSNVEVDAAVDADEVRAPAGTALATIAQAAGVKAKEVESLNPELRAGRTPPGEPGATYAVRVPKGKGTACAEKLAKSAGKGEAPERYVVRTGESLTDIAESHRVPAQKLVELNALAPGEVLHGGTVLLVPKTDDDPKPEPTRTSARAEKPVVVVPADVFVYPDRTRVFYKVKTGDTIDRLGVAFGVTLDELRRWNALDLRARLLDGMTLQVFVKDTKKLGEIKVLGEPEVEVLVAGSEGFFGHFEEKGRKRIVVQAKPGDTLEEVGKRHGVSAKLMERINRRGKSEPLREGENVVLYVAATDPAQKGEPSGPQVSALPPP